MRNPMKCLIAIAVVIALQTSGSFAADAEWDRTVLPRPPQPFEGVTKRTLEGSVAAFTSPVKAPPNAPNILLVLIDDAGFGNPSTFGGPVATAYARQTGGGRTSLQSISRHRALLADARSIAIGAKPSRGRIRFDLRVDRRLARL